MSLRALARDLNLSITTVSRALDGYADVSEATRKRVVAAADAVGYRPNAAARRLRRGAAEMISLVLPTGPGRFDEPLYLELMAELGGPLSEAGFDLSLIAALPGDEELRTYRRIVEGRRADGVIVVRARRDDARIRYLLSTGIPFVVMGRSEVPGDYSIVDGDGEAAFRDATERLIALGHRQIVHLAAPATLTYAVLRAKGYAAAMASAGLEPRQVDCESADETAATASAFTVLSAPRRPTALVCATDRIAYGALRAARTLGLSVPGDLSLIGHDNLPTSSLTDPPLTTMELPVRQTAIHLAAGLLDRIRRPGGAPSQVILPVRFVERASIAPPR